MRHSTPLYYAGEIVWFHDICSGWHAGVVLNQLQSDSSLQYTIQPFKSSCLLIGVESLRPWRALSLVKVANADQEELGISEAVAINNSYTFFGRLPNPSADEEHYVHVEEQVYDGLMAPYGGPKQWCPTKFILLIWINTILSK